MRFQVSMLSFHRDMSMMRRAMQAKAHLQDDSEPQGNLHDMIDLKLI